MPSATQVARGSSTHELACPIQINFPGFEIHATDSVVDVGCGEGAVCAYAGHKGADVVGIDIEREAIDRANHAMRHVRARSWRGIVSECDPIPLPDSHATVVVATEVMEHVDDPRRFLSELVRIGKPGARYLISVPDPASEDVLRLVASRWYWEKPFHQHVFEHAELDTLVRQAGLEIESRHAAGFYWSLHWIFRMCLGMNNPYDKPPDEPLLTSWTETYAALLRTARAHRILESLDRCLPKSQVIVARKPFGSSESSGSRLGSTWSKARWKRRLRDGACRLGGFELRWRVRRLRPLEPR